MTTSTLIQSENPKAEITEPNPVSIAYKAMRNEFRDAMRNMKDRARTDRLTQHALRDCALITGKELALICNMRKDYRRHCNLAYALLKGRKYRDVEAERENKPAKEVNVELLAQILFRELRRTSTGVLLSNLFNGLTLTDWIYKGAKLSKAVAAPAVTNVQ